MYITYTRIYMLYACTVRVENEKFKVFYFKRLYSFHHYVFYNLNLIFFFFFQFREQAEKSKRQKNVMKKETHKIICSSIEMYVHIHRRWTIDINNDIGS